MSIDFKLLCENKLQLKNDHKYFINKYFIRTP